MTVRTILVAHDGSKGAAHALGWAADLARQTEARLVVVHAWSPLEDLSKVRPSRSFHELHEEALAQVREWCTSADGIEIEPRLVEDLPVEGIVQAARDVDADLIVCGTRGLGGVKGLLLGRVARELPGRSHRPVAVVPPPE